MEVVTWVEVDTSFSSRHDGLRSRKDPRRQESNAAAAAAATERPPLAPQSEIIEEHVHGPPEAGGRNPSAATATAVGAEQKGEETMSLFRRDSAGGKSPLPPRPPFVSRASGPSSASGKAPRPTPPPYPMSKEVLASGMVVRDKWKRDVFNELMLEFQRERSEETDQTAEAEGMPRQQNEQVNSPALWPKKVKKLLWRKEIMFKMGEA
ncbi:uncharacterized protein LOC110434817 [Sorghum bicolor]|uniref:uncharacterized protein LOC110434817 n=1 Tax=Sorghum bicolor TaxID=4558 RepID=UPI000B4240A5|nr:uncharacterized protein LOC110434817 [Sorghum bicolor]|eukprot:XP_021315227.1 uncharacterized protein LOC110434817 [Sorghum bicolor]